MNAEEYRRWSDVGRTQVFSTSSLTNLIKNVSIAASVKHVNQLGGFTNAPEWEQMMLRRVGNEPIARLMYVVFRDMEGAGIRLDEVLAYSPSEYIHFFEENQIAVYYDRNPFARTAPQ